MALQLLSQHYCVFPSHVAAYISSVWLGVSAQCSSDHSYLLEGVSFTHVRAQRSGCKYSSTRSGWLLPYCVRRWRTPAVSRCLLFGPCAASAGSAGSAGCAGTWPTHFPGYAPPPPAPRQSARRCLRRRRGRESQKLLCRRVSAHTV